MSTPDMLKTALAYARRGWPVFPCGLDKKPLTSHGFKDASADQGQVRAWWGEHPGASIGVPTGSGLGAWVLDVDMPEGPDTLAALEAQHGPLPVTTEQRTGGGGRQLFFAWPEGREIRNSAGSLGPGLDVRGGGGYVILPPSGHPTGGRYAWTSPKGTKPAEAPGWLLALVCPPKPEPRPAPAKPADGTTPYGRAALEAECGKVAVAVAGTRNHVLNTAAFAVGQLVAGGQVDRGEAEQFLAHAAARAGLPEAEARKTTLSGLAAGEKEPRAPEPSAPPKANQAAPQVESSQPCRTAPAVPVPFDCTMPPAIPEAAVPGVLREFSLALAESIQVPFELALCNVLGAVAAVAQRKFRVVEVRPGYSESLNLYALCPLPPGERKSAVVEACKRPLVEWQAAMRREMEGVIRDARSERLTLEKAIENKRNLAAKAKDADARRAAIEEIKEMEQDLPEVPEAPRLLADDFTPEALAVLMSRHDQRVALLEAEGGLFDILAGRYSNGVPNLDAVLKFWSGEACQIDRRSREPIFLDDPHLTLVISPQPDVVQGLAERPGFRGRGLVGRFLYFMPQSRLGGRAVESSPVPPGVAAAYHEMIHRLLSLPWAQDEHGQKTAYCIPLDTRAYALWRAFAEAVESELRPGGEFEHMTDWAGKFTGQAVRLAGLFHVATVPEPQRTAIGADTMRSALDVAAVLAEHAKAAYGLMGSDPAQECAKGILGWIVRERRETFTARDALRAVRGKYPTMEKVRPGLALLEERAYILPADGQESRGPGRKPSTPYVVNPLTWEAPK